MDSRETKYELQVNEMKEIEKIHKSNFGFIMGEKMANWFNITLMLL